MCCPTLGQTCTQACLILKSARQAVRDRAAADSPKHQSQSPLARLHSSNTHAPPCRPGHATAATSCPTMKVMCACHLLPPSLARANSTVIAEMLLCSSSTAWQEQSVERVCQLPPTAAVIGTPLWKLILKQFDDLLVKVIFGSCTA